MQTQHATEYELALNAKGAHFKDAAIADYYTTWPKPTPEQLADRSRKMFPPWNWFSVKERQSALAGEGF